MSLSHACVRVCTFMTHLSQCAADPSCLPSFPTRRSSDLRSAIAVLVLMCCTIRSIRAALFAGSSAQRRSEEHTSELQSRPHLVCRLLHEKKTHLAHFPISRPRLCKRPSHYLSASPPCCTS